MSKTILQQLADILTDEMPMFWEKMNPFLSGHHDLQSGLARTQTLPIFSIGKTMDITDYFCVPGVNSETIYDGLINCIKGNLQWQIVSAYYRMSKVTAMATLNDFPQQLSQIIQNISAPNDKLTIISIGSNMLALSMEYPELFKYQGKEWSFGNTPIYEFILPVHSQYDSLFVIINQRESFSLEKGDTSNSFFLHNNGVITQDTNNSLEIYASAWEERGALRNEVLVNPLVYMLYNPSITFPSLKLIKARP